MEFVVGAAEWMSPTAHPICMTRNDFIVGCDTRAGNPWCPQSHALAFSRMISCVSISNANTICVPLNWSTMAGGAWKGICSTHRFKSLTLGAVSSKQNVFLRRHRCYDVELNGSLKATEPIGNAWRGHDSFALCHSHPIIVNYDSNAYPAPQIRCKDVAEL